MWFGCYPARPDIKLPGFIVGANLANRTHGEVRRTGQKALPPVLVGEINFDEKTVFWRQGPKVGKVISPPGLLLMRDPSLAVLVGQLERQGVIAP